MKNEFQAEETNNYEKWCEQWREKFLDMDQEKLKILLPELKEEGDWLTICHFGRKLGIHKDIGNIRAMEDDEPVTCYEKLNIYTLFGYVTSLAYFKNEWVKFEKLKNTAPFSKAFQQGIIDPFSRMFHEHTRELEEALQKMGGKKITWSDVGYELNAFECIPVRFLFWEGDEEFPSQGNLLFDASATDFIHGESIVTIAAVGLDRIAKQAGVSRDASAFPVF
ncbi:hypothetical protein B5F53_04115 [Blautia sp. An249]|uniref:DUF3786 domain-containing protein n=1 Tax=Blautia sp. An249 TaxID=1965603 RepID=UPI000B3A3CDC|nr:DUF3786 domain-containing protein [Blautia sp. An249]OUO80160.1 hypothetical protein B5F53_04115 [Blautia sp. An249]